MEHSSSPDIKLISFDCYGTLIDWKKGILNTLVPLFEEYLLDISGDEIFSLFKTFDAEFVHSDFISYRNLLMEIMKRFSSALNINLMKSDFDCLVNSLPIWEPFSDTIENLRMLKRRFKLALITNSDNDLVEKTIALLGVQFDFVITSADVGSYKPSLNNFLTSLETFNLNANQIVHVSGSLYHDIAPCNELGIRNIWINRYKDESSLDEIEKPGYEIKSLKELLTIL